MEDSKYYYSPDDSDFISQSALVNADRDTQLNVMRTWFFKNYEDPVDCEPYDSEEGGYLWIWGGPYEAKYELETEFSDFLPEEVIETLASELDEICYEWTGNSTSEGYTDYLLNEIAAITEFKPNFLNGIKNIKELLEIRIHGPVNLCFYRLLYVNVITTMETYLSDAFIRSVVSSKQLVRRFVEETSDFKCEKIPLSEIFKETEEIEQKVKKHLTTIVWHNIVQVKHMYQNVLDVSFPDEDFQYLINAIMKRHDIVHRNGKTTKDEEIPITQEDVTDLIVKVENFVCIVDQNLSKQKANEWNNESSSR